MVTTRAKRIKEQREKESPKNPGTVLRFGELTYYFYPHTVTTKAEAVDFASRLRTRGFKVRTRNVYSTWNKRKQYEFFTRPKH